ncbi:MAG TPA: response regulator [Acidobacteriaceae bacterium]|jgi:two-component system chemotaxis response regulator CheY|nr:response regulator [Acidobacteriaceae bacterium]
MPGIRALIVDDSAVMRKIVERTLRQGGMDLTTVAEAANGEEALAILRRQTVDLILCDINMPGMDGLELLQQMQVEKLARQVPVVMITTESSESHVRSALMNGAQAYIRKPFTPEQIQERVLPLVAKAG